jgi:WD40 repeat protein
MTLDEHSDSVSAVTWMPNGAVVSGSWDCTLLLWDVMDTGMILKEFDNNNNQVGCVACMSDTTVAYGSFDNTIHIWDTSTNEEVAVYKGHQQAVWCLSRLPNGNFVSGSLDNSCRVWNPKSGAMRCLSMNHISCDGMKFKHAKIADGTRKVLSGFGALAT